MYQPENGWAEQDPSDWSEAAISTIKSVVEKGQVNGKDVRGIGISGQMHGLVMLNEENQVIRRSIIWCDQRATKQVEAGTANGKMDEDHSESANGRMDGSKDPLDKRK